jgi:putative membrane protein insertion efficiency factor
MGCIVLLSLLLLRCTGAGASVLLRDLGGEGAAGTIGFYQMFMSDLRYGNCRFDPSCSQYAADVISKRGLLVGSALAADRLIRCNRSAGRFHSRGPDGRLSDPVGGGPVPKENPEAPSWLMPSYEDPPPLPAYEWRNPSPVDVAPGIRTDLASLAGFADELARVGDCDRAATEYLRIVYLGRNQELRFWAHMRIASCSYAEGAWEDAASEFRQAAPEGPTAQDRSLARFMAAGSAFNALDYERCDALLGTLDVSEGSGLSGCIDPGGAQAVTSEHVLFLSGLNSMALGDWIGAQRELGRISAHCPHSHDLWRAELLGERAREGTRLPGRNPTVAGVFSALIPGTGQMYAGRFTDGVRHLIFDGLLAYTVCSLVKDENYGGAYLVAGIALPFYAGNIVGARRSAQWFNASKRAEHIQAAIADTERVNERREKVPARGMEQNGK